MGRARAPFGGGSAVIDETAAAALLELALAEGGDYADLFFEYKRSGSLSYEEGLLKSAQRGVVLGLGVRVQRGDATGYAYTEELAPEPMRRAARTAAQIARAGAPRSVPIPARMPKPDRYPLEPEALELAAAAKRELMRRADQAARAHDPRISRVELTLTEEHKEILVCTSDGIWVHDVQPLLRFGVRAIAEERGRRQAGSSGGGGRVGFDFFLSAGRRPEDYGREAARVALAMLHAEAAPAGEMPVVLAAGDSGILLHEAVGHGLEADFNRKKTSNYSDRLGQVVASPLVTVVDDPTYAQARGSINVDDEGRTARPSRLIEGGVLAAYLHDRQSGRFFGVAGQNGRRESFRSAPLPRMTNTVMLGGPHTAEEIVRATPRGIYAKRFSGGQVNIQNGDFVFSLTESYLIEDGQITAPLKGVNLIGNGPEVLRRVDMLASDVELSDGIWTCGKDGQSVPVGVGCPTTRISKITVGGTKLGGA